MKVCSGGKLPGPGNLQRLVISFSTTAYNAVMPRITVFLANWGMAFSCGKSSGWWPLLDKSNLRLDGLKSSGTGVLAQALRQAIIAGRLLTSHKHCMKVTRR